MKLVEETIEDIMRHHKTVEDVSWVGSRDGKYSVSWDTFAASFENVDYDDDVGSQEVAADLVVVFTDGSWLERHEYDGAEGWDYSKAPIRSKNSKAFKFVDRYSTQSHTDDFISALDGLASLNQMEDNND